MISASMEEAAGIRGLHRPRLHERKGNRDAPNSQRPIPVANATSYMWCTATHQQLGSNALATICVTVSFAMGACCQAEFVCIEVVDVTSNALGLKEYAIYARFDDPVDTLYGVESSISVDTGFFHNTVQGTQASVLPFTVAQTAMSDHPDVDSFVTIGLSVGDENATVVNPDFDVLGFLFGSTLGQDGAWGLLINNGQGDAGPSGLVLIAVFAPLNGASGAPGVVQGSVTLGYGAADGSLQFVDASFITPAPGAVGLLALAGVAGRSRRRRTGAQSTTHEATGDQPSGRYAASSSERKPFSGYAIVPSRSAGVASAPGCGAVTMATWPSRYATCVVPAWRKACPPP